MKRTLLFISSILFVLSLSAQVPTSGLIAWYPFTGNANDQTLNANNGTVSGATLTTDRFGNANCAYSFNGTSDVITFTSQFPFNQTGDASISMWIKNSSLPSLIQGTFLKSSTGTPDNNRFNFFLNPLSGNELKLNFDYREANSTIHILNIDTITKNTWQHIVYTRVGNTYNLYVNGNLINSKVDNSPNLPTSTGWVLGNDPSSIHDFAGVIDDVRLYNRVLNTNEVKALFNENICVQSLSVTDTLVINMNITGFNPVTYSNNIKIFPNPANDQLNISIANTDNNGYQIKILNSLSQIMFQQTITGSSYSVNLNTFSTGTYFVNVLDSGGNLVEIRKIIIQ